MGWSTKFINIQRLKCTKEALLYSLNVQWIIETKKLMEIVIIDNDKKEEIIGNRIRITYVMNWLRNIILGISI